MDGKKAAGIDGITKEDYEKNLEENLARLVESLKRKAYKPKPARKVEIPKENGKTRPISIYCYEDKLVQEGLREILEAVFEPQFYDNMMGFRPGRSRHQALRKLNQMLEREKTNYVLDADIQGFFNHLDHKMDRKICGIKNQRPEHHASDKKDAGKRESWRITGIRKVQRVPAREVCVRPSWQISICIMYCYGGLKKKLSRRCGDTVA